MTDLKIGHLNTAGVNYSKTVPATPAQSISKTIDTSLTQLDEMYAISRALDNAPIDLQACDKLRTDITQGQYVIDVDQLVDNLLAQDLDGSEYI